MADQEERPDWDRHVAKLTFLTTAIVAALYVGCILVFILYR